MFHPRICCKPDWQQWGTLALQRMHWQHLQHGLVLFPGQSLVSNEGFDGSGTHCAPGAVPADVLGQRAPVTLPPLVQARGADMQRIRRHLIGQRGPAQLLVDNWRRWVGTRAGWAA